VDLDLGDIRFFQELDELLDLADVHQALASLRLW
jgi:hypothetical protein